MVPFLDTLPSTVQLHTSSPQYTERSQKDRARGTRKDRCWSLDGLVQEIRKQPTGDPPDSRQLKLARMSATGNAGPSSTWDADSSKTTTLTVSSASSWLDYLHQVANAVSDQPISSQDPVGSLQPKFSTSVVCQTLAYGIAFALGFVLFGLLLFSARYHWPLSKTNFTMQLAALSIFLLQMALSIAILLEFTRSRSRIWPYMFDYIELALPRDTWNTGQTVAWLFLQGITALSVHVSSLLYQPITPRCESMRRAARSSHHAHCRVSISSS